MIHPTSLQLLERPELENAILRFEHDWLWVNSQGVWPCTADDAALALLDRCLELEDQLAASQRRAQLTTSLQQAAVSQQLLSSLDSGQLQFDYEVGDDV